MPVEGDVILDKRLELVPVLDDEVDRLAAVDLVVAGTARQLVRQRPEQAVPAATEVRHSRSQDGVTGY